MVPWLILGLVVYGIYKQPNAQQIMQGIITADKDFLQQAAGQLQNMATTPSTQQQVVNQGVMANPNMNIMSTAPVTETKPLLFGFGVEDYGPERPIPSPFTRRSYV
jgi:hypothetical protein